MPQPGELWLAEIPFTQGADSKLRPVLVHMQAQTQAPHAFQCVIDSPFVEADCFRANRPVIVPTRTLLSQLL
jgi:uncharacterized protein